MLAKKELQVPQQSNAGRKDDEHSLRGTFASVMLLAALVIVSWVGVFLLYLARN
jgi:hypothetical protein